MQDLIILYTIVVLFSFLVKTAEYNGISWKGTATALLWPIFFLRGLWRGTKEAFRQ